MHNNKIMNYIITHDDTLEGRKNYAFLIFDLFNMNKEKIPLIIKSDHYEIEQNYLIILCMLYGDLPGISYKPINQ